MKVAEDKEDQEAQKLAEEKEKVAKMQAFLDSEKAKVQASKSRRDQEETYVEEIE